MFNTTRRLIRMAIVGTAAYYLYKEKPEEVKAVMDKVLPESVKKEIRKTKDQYESLQELKAAASDMTEGMAKLAGEATETLLKSLQNKEVEEQMAEIQKLRKQQRSIRRSSSRTPSRPGKWSFSCPSFPRTAWAGPSASCCAPASTCTNCWPSPPGTSRPTGP